MPIHPARAGLAVAAVFGAWHLAWALLVAAGIAQPLLDFVFRLHFIAPVYAVREFDAGTAALLVLLTGLVGFVTGWLFGILWNSLHKPS